MRGPIDLLVGGTPCQSFSVAGLRRGLADPRGNLALRFVQLAQATGARWLVWENVPGVLSSGGGRDFGTFLGALVELGYGFAYRVLDAQYFGVPQRRRRVFVVGHLGDWRRAAAVLFERSCLSGNPPPSREAGKGITHSTSPCIGASGRGFERAGETRGQDPVVAVAGTLCSNHGNIKAEHAWTGQLCYGGGNTQGPIAAATAVNAGGCKRLDFDSETPLVPMAFDTTQVTSPGNYSNPKPGDPCHPLANGQHPPAIAFTQNQRDEVRSMDVAGDLSAEPGMKQQAYIAFDCKQSGEGGEVSPPLRALNHDQSHANAGGQMAVNRSAGVRRLTPRECERLQGFPTCIERVIIEACSAHPNSDVVVALRCRRLQSNALHADDSVSGAFAGCADATLWNDQESRESLVAVSVRASHAASLLAVRSRGRFVWSASGAEGSSWCHQSILPDDIAHAIALANRELEASIRNGKVGSQASTRRFILPSRGRWLAEMCGLGSGASVSDAIRRLIEATKYTTSSRGQHTGGLGWTEATWLCFALAVTTSFIPAQTLDGNSYKVILDLERDYTLIEYRGKPAADGPRYKALGNSMAVPVMAWIGRRILAVEQLHDRQQGD